MSVWKFKDTVRAFAFFAAVLPFLLTGCSTWQQHHPTLAQQRQASVPAFKPLTANTKSQAALNLPVVPQQK